MRAALPENLKAAVREPLDAIALIYALLLTRMKKYAHPDRGDRQKFFA